MRRIKSLLKKIDEIIFMIVTVTTNLIREFRDRKS